jgi:hypothetical protein
VGAGRALGELMHFIGYIHDAGKAKDAFELLEGNGIPSFLGNARLPGDTRYSIFVLLEQQVADAQKLLQDDNHVVEHTIDMDQFYDFEDNFDGSGAMVKYSIYALGAAVGLIGIIVAVAVLL